MSENDQERTSAWEDIGHKVPASFAEAVATRGLKNPVRQTGNDRAAYEVVPPEAGMSLKPYETDRIGLAASYEIYDGELCLYTYDKLSSTDETIARILDTMKIKDSIEITPELAQKLVERSQSLLSQHQRAA